ncbi:unnamed protein product, partial [Discosporangium mesarthrocarpum]
WHNILGNVNPKAIKHLGRQGLLEIQDTETTSSLRGTTCKECKSEALSYGRGVRSPKLVGEVVHTDIAGSFAQDLNGIKYVQVFVDEASRDKRVYGLKTKDAATSATKAYLDTMARKGVNVKIISAVGAGEFGRSAQFLQLLTECKVRWHQSPPRTPQSNGIAERAIKHSCAWLGANSITWGGARTSAFSQLRTQYSRLEGSHMNTWGAKLHTSSLQAKLSTTTGFRI